MDFNRKPDIYLGKFSEKKPEQLQGLFYSGGAEGSSWYGGVRPGDYVFVNYGGQILHLCRAKGYEQIINSVNPDDPGVPVLESIKEFTDTSLSNDFTRCKYFVHDLNIVNRVSKSLKNQGFVKVSTHAHFQIPVEDIDFAKHRMHIYIATEGAQVVYKEYDIRVLINNVDEMKIVEVQQWLPGQGFVRYEALDSLYREKNSEKLYTLLELLDYAERDQAPNKKKYLQSVIEDLQRQRYFSVSDPIRLYDNVLVGRLRTLKKGVKPAAITITSGMAATVDEQDGDAQDLLTLDDIDPKYVHMADLLQFNPNLILYGPPGTGKTYATDSIITAFEKKYYDANSDAENATAEHRVKQVTFHQSYSYEEFIEGIRPLLSDAEQGGTELGYRLEDGLFKSFAIEASKQMLVRKDEGEYLSQISNQSQVWKLSLGQRNSNTLYDDCVRNNEIAIDWLNDVDLSHLDQKEILRQLSEKHGTTFGEKPLNNAQTVYAFVNELSIGDIVLIFDSQKTIRLIGIVQSEYKYDKQKEAPHRRSVIWLKQLQYPISILKYNDNKTLTMKTLYRLGKITFSDVLQMIQEHSAESLTNEDRKLVKPYYIVIDEINRGNISKIFGELITLIEQDKRGRETVLPYSKKLFKVPDNLYMIGTMNTADRSIASIDTALRRRFTFVELAPDAKVLEQGNPIIQDQVNLVHLLEQLNQRIMTSLGRDHRIGHAYFMNIDSLKTLHQVWFYKILPLLSEYFYHDVEAMRGIVGNVFIDDFGNPNPQMLQVTANDYSQFVSELQKICKESQS